jgi:hypothetical protein
MSLNGALILVVALTAHLGGLGLLWTGARWLGRQRRLGYPDPRARAIDRRGLLLAIATGYVWANVVVLVTVAAIAGRS